MTTAMASPSPLPSTSLTPEPQGETQITDSTAAAFAFPPHHSFPPFFTLQPNLTTLSRQLALWSSLIQTYCATHRIFRLALSDAASTPLFHNARINRRLDLLSMRRVVDHMASAEGDRRAEWAVAGREEARRRRLLPDEQKNTAWVWWRKAEEWADAIHGWVDATGQRGSVLTVYELREGEETAGQDWVGMDEDVFRRCLDVLVKRGKAQVFNTGTGTGAEGGEGVKFF